MSDLFAVTVVGKGSKYVDLRLVIVHPDQLSFPTRKSFALMLVWEPSFVSYTFQNQTVFNPAPCAIGEMFSPETILDADFVREHQDDIIESVALLETHHFPFQDKLLNLTPAEIDAFWADEEKLPAAVLKIIVTDPKWIEHLRVGMSWRSTAFSVIP